MDFKLVHFSQKNKDGMSRIERRQAVVLQASSGSYTNQLCD